MFSKSKQSPESAPATPQRNYSNVRNSSGHTFSVIASDVEIVGNLTARVDLHVDGKVQGDVTCGNLVQGEGSIIAGKVIAESAKLSGLKLKKYLSWLPNSRPPRLWFNFHLYQTA